MRLTRKRSIYLKFSAKINLNKWFTLRRGDCEGKLPTTGQKPDNLSNSRRSYLLYVTSIISIMGTTDYPVWDMVRLVGKRLQLWNDNVFSRIA